jgi:hypothetical protein
MVEIEEGYVHLHLPLLKVLNCSYNKLHDVHGCPASVTKLYCNNNQVTTLLGLPLSVQELCTAGNPLSPEWQDKTPQEIRSLNQRKRGLVSPVSVW